jgi:hypothetical protein
LARLTRGVSALGEASQWLVAVTSLPHNSGASHGVPKGPPMMKRLWAAVRAPPQPPRCLQLQMNHQKLELNCMLGCGFAGRNYHSFDHYI